MSGTAEPVPLYEATLSTSVYSVLENDLQSITVGGSTPEEVAENIQKAME